MLASDKELRLSHTLPPGGASTAEAMCQVPEHQPIHPARQRALPERKMDPVQQPEEGPSDVVAPKVQPQPRCRDGDTIVHARHRRRGVSHVDDGGRLQTRAERGADGLLVAERGANPELDV